MSAKSLKVHERGPLHKDKAAGIVKPQSATTTRTAKCKAKALAKGRNYW